MRYKPGMNRIPTLKEIRSLNPDVEAIFFDMDGTLFNTEPIHGLAIKLIIDQKHKDGMSLQQIEDEFTGHPDYMVYTSLKNRDLTPDFSTWSDFLATKNRHMFKLIETLDKNTFPKETKTLLDDILSSKLKLALVTSSERIITDAMLKHFNIVNHFELITTRDDVTKYKPNPEPYLHTMEILNVDSPKAVIFEDSSAGITAAKASNARVIKADWFH